ncbi:MAG: response regulator [Polyangiaceae bacterium]
MKPTSISRSLFIAVVTPIALLIFAAALLMYQIERLTQAAAWVDHTDRVIGTLSRVQSSIVDQETALRGYLLAGTNDFLDPYRNAHPHAHIQQLRYEVSDNPIQERRAAELASTYDRWFKKAQQELERSNTTTTVSVEAMRFRRFEMDEIRGQIATMREDEERLRHDRQVILATSRTTTFAGILPALVVFGIVIAVVSRKQLVHISSSFSEALTKENIARQSADLQAWSREQQAKLSEALMGDLSVEEVCTRTTAFVAEAAKARVAAYYLAEGESLELTEKYALPDGVPTKIARGEGLVGAALSKHDVVHIRDVPKGYLKVASATGTHEPEEIVLLPTYIDRMPFGVLELGFFGEVEPRVLDMLSRVGDIIAGTIRAARQKHQLRELLDETQRQAEELQTQHEELNASNEELLQQTDAVRAAHAELTERKEELEASNASLEAQKAELVRLSDELQLHADELARTSRYRSDFVANMSHELRTPLNSSLILARMLAENKRGNLDAEQVKYAETIFAAGNDLLTLINDILDISRIEAGKVDVHLETLSLPSIVQSMTRMFEPVAKQRSLDFEVVAPTGDVSFKSDSQRVEQILKNLLSNAFKFTEKGNVTLRVEKADREIVFVVADSGIGIDPRHHEAIFEAFRQADGTTNRRFGGTGLGLSISRELARLLGGDVSVESEEGKGSAFTLRLPLVPSVQPAPSVPTASETSGASQHVRIATPSAGTARLAARPAEVRKKTPAPFRMPPATIKDDRDSLDGQSAVLLIVEDDASFASVVAEIARELGFQCLVATTADEALLLASKVIPASIVLDVKLPDHSGLSVLDRLKRNAATRHVPVHVISASDKSRSARSLGAVGYDQKPIKRDALVAALTRMRELSAGKRRVLLLADDPAERASVSELLRGDDVEIIVAESANEARECLKAQAFDCIVADLSQGNSELELDRLDADGALLLPPVVLYTERSLSTDDEMRLRRHANSIIVKGPRSPERLLDEVTLFLHQVTSQLPPERQKALARTQNRESTLQGRHILLAEDDVRNVFAITSLLEGKGAKLLTARNGRQAVDLVTSREDIDLILMDVMMPEMDGIEAMQEIRKRGGRFAKVPIIAITAKAMPDDQARCIKAGANDYIAKPLDVEMLLSLIRVWLSS